MNRLFATGVFLIALACGVLFVPFMQGRLKYNDLANGKLVEAFNRVSGSAESELSLEGAFDNAFGKSRDFSETSLAAQFDQSDNDDTEPAEDTSLTKSEKLTATFEDKVTETLTKNEPLELEEETEEIEDDYAQEVVEAAPLHNKIAAYSRAPREDVFKAFVEEQPTETKEPKEKVNLDSNLLENSENMLLAELLKYRKQVRELNYSLELSVDRESKLARQVAKLKASSKNQKKAKVEKQNTLKKENDSLKNKLSKIEKELEIAKNLLKERSKEFTSLQNKQKIDAEILSSQEHKVKKLEKELASAVEKVGECSFELTDAKRDISSKENIKKELVSTKHELLLKDAEIKNLTSVGAKKESKKDNSVDRVASSNVKKAVAKINRETQNDVLTVKVNVKKANLRNGPGMEHSAIMQLPLGATLVVEARQGDWYRVISPKGSRAFIKAEVVKALNQRGERSSQLVTRPAPKKRVAKTPRPEFMNQLSQRAQLKKNSKQPSKKARFVGSLSDVPKGFVPFEKTTTHSAVSPKDEIERRAYEALKKRLLRR